MLYVPTCLHALRALRANVPYVPSYLRAYVHARLKLLGAYLPTFLRALIYLSRMCLRAYVLIYILRASVPSCLKLVR